MSRYIDVSEDAIKAVFNKLYHKNIYPKVTDKMVLRNYLDEFPTADVVEVKHGEWKGKPIAGNCTVRCSVCGDAFLDNNGRWNYCPNCGARMDGGRDDKQKSD